MLLPPPQAWIAHFPEHFPPETTTKIEIKNTNKNIDGLACKQAGKRSKDQKFSSAAILLCFKS